VYSKLLIKRYGIAEEELMAESEDQDELAAELQALKQQAKDLGIFTNDRELLQCPKCGLRESVAFDGALLTCRGNALTVDTGLRFPEPDAEGKRICPGCGGEVAESA